jgi:hypothetical protein
MWNCGITDDEIKNLKLDFLSAHGNNKITQDTK